MNARLASSLMDAVMASRTEAPYLDVLQRHAGLSDEDMQLAMRELADTGRVMLCCAPNGRLLYPTLRGAKAYTST